MPDPAPDYGPLLTLADALVTELQSEFATVTIDGEDLDVTVAWSDNPTVALKDSRLKSPLVFVVDFAERSDTGDGVAFEEFELIVLVTMKRLGADKQAAQARALKTFCSQIARHLVPRDGVFELELSESESVPCFKAERKPAHVLSEWDENGRFFAEIVTTWRRY